jgi:hypothetical protein
VGVRETVRELSVGCARDHDCTMKRDIFPAINFFSFLLLYEILFIDIRGIPPHSKDGGGWMGRTLLTLYSAPDFFTQYFFYTFTG